MAIARIALLLGVAVGGIAFAVNCGFPSPQILPDEGVTAEAGADVESTSEGGALPPDVDPNGKDQDAAVRDDASVPRPEAGPDGAPPPVGCAATGANPCDCDGDGAFNNAKGCLPIGEKADCDDYDKLISPKQTSFVKEPWDPKSPAKEGDWDCDTNVLKQFPYDVKCELLNCGLQGFSGHPDCGQPGQYIFCKPVVVNLVPLCVVDKTETRIQGCK